MRDELSQDIFGTFMPEPSHEDPVKRAQIQMKRPLPKRFYQDVSVAECEAGYAILLDRKPVKTPGKSALVLPSRDAAALVAGEWAAQGETINPVTMPVTKLANTAIDAVANNVDEVLEEILRFAGSDLLCYRAEGPKELVERQSAQWDPVLSWFGETHGARFILAEGVIHQTQPQDTLKAYGAVMQAYCDPFRLSCLNVITTLSGSAILALAFAKGAIEHDRLWSLAHLDEDWSIELWGEDAEAQARRHARHLDFSAAVSLFHAVGPQD